MFYENVKRFYDYSCHHIDKNWGGIGELSPFKIIPSLLSVIFSNDL